MPLLKDWMMETIGIELEETSFSVDHIDVSKVPEPIINEEFQEDMQKEDIEFTVNPLDRFFYLRLRFCILMKIFQIGSFSWTHL